MSDDFYVGYQPQAPAGLRSFLRPVIALLLCGAAGLAAMLASAQGPFRPSVFEFGVEREFVGFLSAQPVPALFARVPGHHDPAASALACGGRYSVFPLARSGAKFGVDDAVRPYDGQLVRLRGSLVYLGRETLIDTVPDSIQPIAGGPGPTPEVQDLGVQTLTGEIVDTKCHFGVMDPSTGKLHRACAARCLSGGVPPALHVEDEAGRVANLMLVDAEGRALRGALLDRVGEPVRVTGRVARHEDLLVLYADPRDIERL